MIFNSSNEMANSLENINKTTDTFKMATVTSVVDGDVFLTFYGETEQREKSYKRLASYTPTVGDKVLVAKLNKSYTILGKVV